MVVVAVLGVAEARLVADEIESESTAESAAAVVFLVVLFVSSLVDAVSVVVVVVVVVCVGFVCELLVSDNVFEFETFDDEPSSKLELLEHLELPYNNTNSLNSSGSAAKIL